MTTTTTTTCTKQVAALLPNGERTIRPCVRDAGHDGVCRYRRVEAVCPPWCSGHNEEGWQEWDEYAEAPHHRRNHASQDGPIAGHAGVELLVEETEVGLSEPKVTIYLANDDEDLTPAQARQLAAALLEAADVIEAAGL